MVTALGGFSGQLDDKLQLKDVVVYIPTDKTGLTAKHLRVKIFHREEASHAGRVSAVVQGVSGALERSIYPQYRTVWDLRSIPEIPKQLAEGKVKPADFRLDDCLPEIERCQKAKEAKRLNIEPAVPSVGFVVRISLEFTNLQPGLKITGVVALSDE